MKSLWDMLWKVWYPVLTGLTGDARVVFLNYGYAEADGGGPPLDASDEPDRACIQLYHRVATSIDVAGLDVLEVSCGHGGGAAYVARYLKPRSMHGIDRNPRAVALCHRRHRADGLTFSVGNAMALHDVGDATRDAVLNVEASHCYPDVPRFLAEVRRVLRPGGHLLYADFRRRGAALATLEAQMDGSGMTVLRRDDISPAVVRGMESNDGRSRDLIRTLVPAWLRRPAMSFAGVTGSPIHRSLRAGETAYVLYVLRRPTA